MYFLTVFYYANIWAVLITLRRKLCQLRTPFPPSSFFYTVQTQALILGSGGSVSWWGLKGYLCGGVYNQGRVETSAWGQLQVLYTFSAVSCCHIPLYSDQGHSRWTGGVKWASRSLIKKWSISDNLDSCLQ